MSIFLNIYTEQNLAIYFFEVDFENVGYFFYLIFKVFTKTLSVCFVCVEAQLKNQKT